MSRLSLPAAGLLLGLLAAVPAVGQPPADLPPGMPSPLELVRGLREQGAADLALEYLTDLEKNPPKSLAPEERAVLPLERAKCLLDAVDEEPDEAVRADRIAEAKSAFDAFRKQFPSHPRAAEASLALARLTAMEARAELGKALRMEVDANDDEGKKKQKAAAAATRGKFLDAAADFGAAANLIQSQLDNGKLDVRTKQALERERFEAALAKGINQYNIADTYIHADPKEVAQRQDYIEAAKKTFEELRKAPDTNRAHWLALAWLSECDYAISKTSDAEREVKAILAAKPTAAAEGKRLVGFFQLRRAYLNARSEPTLKGFQDVEKQIRAWLLVPGNNPRRPTPESVAANYYLATILKDLAEFALRGVKADPKTGLYNMSNTTRVQLDQAERILRGLANSDNDYTNRAMQARMRVVRLMVGEATRPAADYTNFELCSMAALVQIVGLNELDATVDQIPIVGQLAGQDGRDALRKQHLERVITLLERARALATEKDPPADVAQVILLLIHFYNETGQPFQAAVLGDHAARTLGKAVGPKAAAAGSMAVRGYVLASSAVKAGEGVDEAKVDEAKKADRERAIRLALFLDERYPADPATDMARHQLGLLLYEESRLPEAYEVLIKIRPGYQRVTPARLLEGAVAQQLLASNNKADEKGSLPDEKKPAVFRRVVADLEKLPKPSASAPADEVAAYVRARCRMAQLYLLQHRVDPEGERAATGAVKASDVAAEVAGMVEKADPPAFPCLYKEGGKELNGTGKELKFVAENTRTRAVYLRGKQLLDAAKDAAGVTAALKVMDPILAEMEKGPLNNDELKKWAEAKDPDEKDKDEEAAAAFKGRVLALADETDRYRQTIVVQALKARIRQNQVDDALKLIDLLKRYGGSVEKNQYVFQQLTIEMQGQILALKREKKDAEAKTLTDGFSKLLGRLAAEPNLPATLQLFLGNSLNAVGEHAKAVEVLDRVLANKPAPAKLDPAAFAQLPEAEQKQVSIYRVAALSAVRALRQTGQKPNLDRAEAMLNEAMGNEKKPGYGARILDFHKEVALVDEAKGSIEPVLKQANADYGKALKKWNELARAAQARFANALNPMPGMPKAEGSVLIQYRNAYLDAFFDAQRCLYTANKKLLSGPDPKLKTRLDKTTESVANSFVNVEKGHPHNEIDAEIKHRYHDFLEENPPLKAAYTAAGGTFFLKRD